MKDYNKVIFDMAKSNGVGRLIVGPNVIPVKVTDIRHEHTIDSQETEFKCLAVDSTAAYTDTDSMYPAINSLYGMFSGRFSGKSYEEYQAMKDQLRKGCKLVPVGTNGSWAAVAYCEPDKKSGGRPWSWKVPGIDKVIFSNPATIVFWTDGEKTVVKAQNGEPYDPEKGLAMAITKRALGNKGNYCNVLNEHLTKGMENSTPEQFNSEVCHIQKCDDIWNKHMTEMTKTVSALAALSSAIENKKATKAQILDAVNEAIGYLRPDEKDKK